MSKERHKTMTTDYNCLYNQIFLVFIHRKITCQLAMTNDWEILIAGSKWAQIFRKHVKANLVDWKIAAGHRPTSVFHNKKMQQMGWNYPTPSGIRLKRDHFTVVQLQQVREISYFIIMILWKKIKTIDLIPPILLIHCSNLSSFFGSCCAFYSGCSERYWIN